MAEYKIKDAKNADLDEIYFDKNVGKMCYKNALGIITTLETSGNVVQSVVAGTNVNVDNTDPANPIVNAAGGGLKGIHSLVDLASNDITFVQAGGVNMTQTGLVSNRITLSPFIPNQNITTSTLDITLNAAQAGSNARILIYSNLNGLPDSKIYESATLDLTTATGIKTATTTQTFLAGTTYWIGVHTVGGASLSAMNASMMFPINIIGTTPNTVIYKDVTFGLAPTNFGIPTGYLNLSMYLIRITKA